MSWLQILAHWSLCLLGKVLKGQERRSTTHKDECCSLSLALCHLLLSGSKRCRWVWVLPAYQIQIKLQVGGDKVPHLQRRYEVSGSKFHRWKEHISYLRFWMDFYTHWFEKQSCSDYFPSNEESGEIFLVVQLHSVTCRATEVLCYLKLCVVQSQNSGFFILTKLIILEWGHAWSAWSQRVRATELS